LLSQSLFFLELGNTMLCASALLESDQ